MNVIVVTRSGGAGSLRHWDLARPRNIAAVAGVIAGVFAVLFAVGLSVGEHEKAVDAHRTFSVQKTELADLKARASERADAIKDRMEAMNAHLTRVNDLVQKVASIAKVDRRQFGHVAAPADKRAASQKGFGDLLTELTNLEYQAQLQDTQLAALGNILNGRAIEAATRPAGAPVKGSVISSYYGWRKDPVNGEDGHFHEGIDFAGKIGQPVYAVAAGIVTKSGNDAGYGGLVEVNHGNGYLTRYAHNSRLVVAVGEIVLRGQLIAVIGSTGRSTGPHLHFEVRRNGYPINPLPFIQAPVEPAPLTPR